MVEVLSIQECTGALKSINVISRRGVGEEGD
jgi:hypothetical protein